jgi:cation diffusion facilitator CzcD-associated flavoprotein CzcO
VMTKFPKFIRNALTNISLRLQVGDFRDYGLERPAYPITNCHPVLNSELLYKIRHGKVQPRKGIRQIDGRTVEFEDGKKEEFDAMIAATGYKISFPFFDKNFLNWEDTERIPLYLRMLHPEHPSLFFIGLLQPQGCVWPLSDLQSKLVANIIGGKARLPENIYQLAEEEASQIAREFISAKRHSVEVHYEPFVKKLRRHLPA